MRWMLDGKLNPTYHKLYQKLLFVKKMRSDY